MSIKIFCDIADHKLIKKYNKKKIVKGFTTNPSLMRKAGANNYKIYSKKLIKTCNKKPISLEVFADDFKSMINQGIQSNHIYFCWESRRYRQRPGARIFEKY